jgi:sugar O-acyltransferase (sialic acid O-acetyltransferase NeuD family)
MTSPGRLPLILVGGGGHCLSCVEIIESLGQFEIAGIVDRNAQRGAILFGYPVLGGDDDLAECVRRFRVGVVTVGQIHGSALRQRLYRRLVDCGAEIPLILSPHASISARSEIGRGTIVFHNAAVNAGAKIGLNCIINTGAIVEHGATVGDHVHISTGAVVNGDCHVGDGAFIGSGTVVLQGVSIAAGTVIGASSLVRRSVVEAAVYGGTALRRIGPLKEIS